MTLRVIKNDDNCSEYDRWVSEGLSLNKDYSNYKWCLGDWWNAGHAYGERKALVDGDNWDGPKFQTCMNAGSLASMFTISRRREVLSFGHHIEVQGLPVADQDKLLDECEANGLSIVRLRQRVKEVREG